MLEGRSAGEYMEGMTSIVRREPVGVCAQVAPWNYPMMMAVWKFAPALAAGNTVVLKPSDTTPASTRADRRDHRRRSLPKGVFNVICGDRETGRPMVEHPTPAMASITGSVRAGMQVAESAAKDVKRVHLELGGKAPVVVFEDTDIAKAVEDISVAGFFNAGQDCTAATRVLVHESIHDEFVAALAKAAADTKTGQPDDEDVLYGPLNNANQLEQVTGFIERLPAHAKVEAGGHRVGEKGYFYAPTVVSGLKQDDEIIQNEVFGPVITVQSFTDEAQALEYANGVEYALASSVWTKDHARAMRMSKAPRLRLRVDQHPHPARRRDAARRLQEVRLRQGPLRLRLRGLHAHQARHDLARRLIRHGTGGPPAAPAPRSTGCRGRGTSLDGPSIARRSPAGMLRG